METLEKKICDVSAGYSQECTPDELDLLYAEAKDCPDNSSLSAFFLKELLIDHLEGIAKEASRKRPRE